MVQSSIEAQEIGRFICARRESTDASAYPELPARRRHVPHLTQSDLAELIGISTVVISQIELGRYPNLNSAILHRISDSLRFTQQQNTYLFGLLNERPSSQSFPEPPPAWVATSIRHIEHPVLVVNPALDLVGINDMGKKLFSAFGPTFVPPHNCAEAVFRIPDARDLIVDWDDYAASLVSGMRVTYAMFPSWRDHVDAVTHQLASIDELFNKLWNQDDPLVKPTFDKVFLHPDEGTLNVMQVLTDIIEVPGLTSIDFPPRDDETGRKFERMASRM